MIPKFYDRRLEDLDSRWYFAQFFLKHDSFLCVDTETLKIDEIRPENLYFKDNRLMFDSKTGYKFSTDYHYPDVRDIKCKEKNKKCFLNEEEICEYFNGLRQDTIRLIDQYKHNYERAQEKLLKIDSIRRIKTELFI